MSKIDSVRLSGLFRSLSSTGKPTGAESTTTVNSGASKDAGFTVGERFDRKDLRRRLKGRLADLNLTIDSDKSDAVIVVVQEILIWEFGDEVLSDPNFSRMTKYISKALSCNAELNAQFLAMAASFK